MSLGCAQGQSVPLAPPPVPLAGKGMIFVYWPEGLIRSQLPNVFPDGLKERYAVLVDEKETGAISMGEYVAVEVAPGKHHVHFTPPLDLLGPALKAMFDYKGVPVDSTAGGSHYFELAWTGKYVEMFERPTRTGREALTGLKRR